jgi:hypothetical protein
VVAVAAGIPRLVAAVATRLPPAEAVVISPATQRPLLARPVRLAPAAVVASRVRSCSKVRSTREASARPFPRRRRRRLRRPWQPRTSCAPTNRESDRRGVIRIRLVGGVSALAVSSEGCSDGPRPPGWIGGRSKSQPVRRVAPQTLDPPLEEIYNPPRACAVRDHFRTPRAFRIRSCRSLAILTRRSAGNPSR